MAALRQYTVNFTPIPCITSDCSIFRPIFLPLARITTVFTSSSDFSGTLEDTVPTPPPSSPSFSFAVDATMDSVGRWLLHCHVSKHMENGMIAVVSARSPDITDPVISDDSPLAKQP